MSEADSWSDSHDMLMIDEVHTSEESENLSHHSKHQHAAEQSGGHFMEDFGPENEEMTDEFSWQKVTQRKHRRKHIELKDLTENDFLSMIEAKNQDKRFYGWLNFQPLFQGIGAEDPTKEHERQLKTEMEEDQFMYFNDLFGLHLEDEDSEMQADDQ